ncbi:MAG: polysaccharide biosynthesis tyrosine autokinase [Acidimicrobiales bacterium]
MPPVRPVVDSTREPDIRDYLRMVWRRRRIIVAIVVVVVLASLGASLAAQPIYEARTTMVLQDQSKDPFTDTSVVSLNPDRTVQTEIAVFGGRDVRDVVAKSIGAAPKVSVASLGQTNAFSITARAPEAAQAADIANAYAQAYIASTRLQALSEINAAVDQIGGKVDDLKRQINVIDSQPPSAASATARDSLVNLQAGYQQKVDQLQVSAGLQTGRATVSTPAVAPGSPVTPQPVRNAILALIVGLILGLGTALLIEYLDDSITTKESLEAALHGTPILGTIPAVTGWKDTARPRVETLLAPTSPAAEAYRSLRTAVQFLGLEREQTLVEVTSPRQGDGKTTTAVNLAVSLANGGQRVCLVGCDLRRPRVHEFFELDNQVGLTSVITGESSISDAVQAVDAVPGLDLLASGALPPNPAEVLAGRQMREVLVRLRARFDIVILDCSPVLPVTDAVVLAPAVDVVLVVARSGSTRTHDVERADDALRQVQVAPSGGVLNAITAEFGGYGYGYGYGYSATPDRARRADRPRART